MKTDDALLLIDKARYWALTTPTAAFYGSLAGNLSDVVIDDRVPTAATDGTRIIWNPTWVATLTEQEVRFVLLHETLHCAHNHFDRLPHTEEGNVAGDYAINATLEKIAGITMCESYTRQHSRRYTSAMPCNLYGPGDNYDPEGSHVIPAIIRKVHHAKVRHEPSVPVWGTGTPRREFLFVDDLADGCIRLMELGYDGPFVNIGSGTDVTIRELVELVMDVVGYTGSIELDTTKPDGTPRKLMDVSKSLRGVPSGLRCSKASA